MRVALYGAGAESASAPVLAVERRSVRWHCVLGSIEGTWDPASCEAGHVGVMVHRPLEEGEELFYMLGKHDASRIAPLILLPKPLHGDW